MVGAGIDVDDPVEAGKDDDDQRVKCEEHEGGYHEGGEPVKELFEQETRIEQEHADVPAEPQDDDSGSANEGHERGRGNFFVETKIGQDKSQGADASNG